MNEKDVFMENYGQGISLKNLRKVANIFMLVMAGIAFPGFFLSAVIQAAALVQATQT